MELNKDKASRLESLLTDNERGSNLDKVVEQPPKPVPEDKITIKEAFYNILKLQGYPILSMLLAFGYQLLSTIIVGTYTSDEIAAQYMASYGISLVIQGLFYTSLIVAFNNSVTTLISQAYGQREYRLCGLYMNRQIILNGTILIPLSMLSFFYKEMFLFLGQSEEIAIIGASYLKYSIPGYFFNSFSLVYVRFLAGHREMKTAFIANLISIITHWPITYYFSVTLGL